MPIADRFRSAENEILRVKADLSRISRDRLLAYREGRPDEATRHQFRLLEAELKNIKALASYVRTVSPAAARELTGWHSAAAERFGELRETGDVVALQRWLKEQLAPLLNKSEQAGYLIATSIRLEKGKRAKPFGWRPRRKKLAWKRIPSP